MGNLTRTQSKRYKTHDQRLNVLSETPAWNTANFQTSGSNSELLNRKTQLHMFGPTRGWNSGPLWCDRNIQVWSSSNRCTAVAVMSKLPNKQNRTSSTTIYERRHWNMKSKDVETEKERATVAVECYKLKLQQYNIWGDISPTGQTETVAVKHWTEQHWRNCIITK